MRVMVRRAPPAYKRDRAATGDAAIRLHVLVDPGGQHCRARARREFSNARESTSGQPRFVSVAGRSVRAGRRSGRQHDVRIGAAETEGIHTHDGRPSISGKAPSLGGTRSLSASKSICGLGVLKCRLAESDRAPKQEGLHEAADTGEVSAIWPRLVFTEPMGNGDRRDGPRKARRPAHAPRSGRPRRFPCRELRRNPRSMARSGDLHTPRERDAPVPPDLVGKFRWRVAPSWLTARAKNHAADRVSVLDRMNRSALLQHHAGRLRHARNHRAGGASNALQRRPGESIEAWEKPMKPPGVIITGTARRAKGRRQQRLRMNVLARAMNGGEADEHAVSMGCSGHAGSGNRKCDWRQCCGRNLVEDTGR